LSKKIKWADRILTDTTIIDGTAEGIADHIDDTHKHTKTYRVANNELGGLFNQLKGTKRNNVDRLKRLKVQNALSALSPSTYFSTKFIEVAKFMAATVSSVIHNLHSTHFDDKSILVLTGPYCSECLSPAKFGRYVKVKETKCSKCGGKIVKAKKIKWG